MLQVLVQLAFAQLVGAARLRHIRQVRVDRQRVPQRLGDEDLPRRIRQVLDSADDVGDRKVVIVHNAGQMIQTGTIGPLYHVILFRGPIESDIAANPIRERASPLAGHLESHHRLPALRLEIRLLLGCFRHPAAAVQEGVLFPFRRFPLGLQFLGASVIPVSAPVGEQRLHRLPMPIHPLRLKIGSAWPADVRTFVPVDTQPAKALQDRLQRLFDVPLLIRIIDAQDELSAMLPGVQPVEQGGAYPADVQITCRAGCKTSADHVIRLLGG